VNGEGLRGGETGVIGRAPRAVCPVRPCPVPVTRAVAPGTLPVRPRRARRPSPSAPGPCPVPGSRDGCRCNGALSCFLIEPEPEPAPEPVPVIAALNASHCRESRIRL
jgi:hypothetical protein